jgi:hypothetical protein
MSRSICGFFRRGLQNFELPQKENNNSNAMKTTWTLILLLAALMMTAPGQAADSKAPDYAVVVSKKTLGDADWTKVVDALVKKHSANVVSFDADLTETLPALRQQFPRYVCFVVRPEEASREFVAKIHRLTRRFDDDPYPDCFWGILTGYDAANALRIATTEAPLVVHKAASGTEIALDCCEQGTWFSELKKNQKFNKNAGQPPAADKGPDDTTRAIADLLTDYKADLFVTSGHATEHDWQIGYGFPGGQFRCKDGQLFGLDRKGEHHSINSPNPKVFMPIGNCLMGHIDGRDSMALAYMNSAGVNQMIGYTVVTWYGYAGWGCLDYFVEQPGRYTFNEAFFANQNALIHRIATYFPELVDAELDDNGRPNKKIVVGEKAKAAGLTAQDALGLLYDRDTLAFYGDPAWEARMATMDTAWEQTLTEKAGVWTLEITPKRGAKSFEPINLNGSQRGGRPIIQFLPRRIKAGEIITGTEFNPLITDNFILVPNPRRRQIDGPIRVAVRAESVD